MPAKRVKCADCGADIALVPFVPDHTVPSRTPRDPGTTSWVPLDPKPVPDNDPRAPYAALPGLTRCHRITTAWPVCSPERAHTVHHQTCPATRPAPTTGDTDDDDD